MTNEQKQKIAELRNAGISYAKIGEMLGISKNTVKTYCRRHNLNAAQKICTSEDTPTVCRQCGAPILQAEKHKTRVFCGKACREKWWHSHTEQINRKAVYTFSCAGCGKIFSAYGNRHRKYCSHECYIRTRFNGGERNE